MENAIFNETKVSKAYIKLSLPLVLSMAVTLIYNLADTYFVARSGNTDIVAGVSLGAPIFTLLMAVGNIFGQGGASLISRLMGSGDREGAARVSSYCFWVTIAVGALTGALMLRRQVVTMVCVGLILLMTIICQSMGKAAASFRLSVSRQGGVFLAVLPAARRTVGYRGIVWAQAVADIITLTVARAVYFKVLRREFKK